MNPVVRSALIGFGVVEAGLLLTGAALAATGSPPLATSGYGAEQPDEAEAQRVAKQFLDAVDWSKPTLMIWMPGIVTPPGIKPELVQALDATGASHWSGAVEYTRDANIKRNVPTGARALEIVLEEIRRRDPDGSKYRVSVGAESLGAWAASEAMTKPVGEIVDRAVFFGRSATAPQLPEQLRSRVHSYAGPFDPATMPYIGSAELWADSGEMTFGGSLTRLPGALLHVLMNPYQAIVGAVELPLALNGPEAFKNHPHNYWRDFPEAASYLVGS